MDKYQLQERAKQFALRIMKLAAALPDNPAGKIIKHQLIKCGTSVGANYRAACRGRSKAEFTAKLGTVEEEADESAFWMELIIDGKLLSKGLVESLLTEANELTAIFAKSVISAKKRS